MKKLFISILFVVALIHCNLFGQKDLDSILVKFPAESTAELGLYLDQLCQLGSPAVVTMAQRLKGHLAGKYDLKEHYALAGLAKYVGDGKHAEWQQTVEEGFNEALQSDLDIEAEVFLIEQMRSFAGDGSVELIASKINQICEPAVQTLAVIGSPKALSALEKALNESLGYCRLVIVKAIGNSPSPSATKMLANLTNDQDQPVRMAALTALARSADPQSAGALVAYAKSQPNPGNDLLLEYGDLMAQKGRKDVLANIIEQVLEVGDSRQKAIATGLATKFLEDKMQKTLLKTMSKGSEAEALAITQALVNDPSLPLPAYFTSLNKVSAKVQTGLLSAARVRKYIPALSEAKSLLKAADPILKTEAVRTVSQLAEGNSISDLQNVIVQENDQMVVDAAIEELSRWVDASNLDVLKKTLALAPAKNKPAMLDLIASRGVEDMLGELETYLQSSDATIRSSAFQALPKLISGSPVNDLMALVSIAQSPSEIEHIQEAFKAKASQYEHVSDMIEPLLSTFGESSPALLSKILPAIGGRSSLDYIKNMSDQSSLLDWKYPEVIPDLFPLLEIDSKRNQGFENIVRLIKHPDLPNDQKVLYLRKLLPFAKDQSEQEQIIGMLGNTKSHVAFIFLKDQLKQNDLKVATANALVRCALPSAGEDLGLYGSEIKMGLMQADTILAEQEDGYTTSILRRYLTVMPEEGGFISLFNGQDLTGWQGLVLNPIARDSLFSIDLKSKQIEADAKLADNWKVENGAITFFGEGYDNLCSVESYRDFELVVDWKITKNGDSGIYLRGSPQVQIWDTSMTEIGAQVGSGGLYNNQKHESKPLKVADNPVGEWNTFRIIMIEDKVTVYLNGELVTDNVVLENYWNRELPIFRSGPIELQAHGTNLQFRDIYVREIHSAPDLSEAEQKAGFKTLFNGINLDGWVGNKIDYVVKDGELVIYPGGSGGSGNLYTENEYDNFTLRFEFKLTPGANNGLGIHAPLEGDAAYVGKEIQILDNTAPIYANLKDYQYHGSVYGLVAAKKGALNPVGEWNKEEVIVKGNQIWVMVNNQRILFDDLDNATRNGTLDGKDHPGLKRLKGHIGFLGHGSEVHFRNIRIKEDMD